MGKVITVEQAELKTATVEIRHLIVSARKMTLSVFRQIEHEPLLLRNGNTFGFAGMPWGRVGYYWGDHDRDDLHILWQKGRELRRSLVSRSYLLTTRGESEKTAEYIGGLVGRPCEWYVVEFHYQNEQGETKRSASQFPPHGYRWEGVVTVRFQEAEYSTAYEIPRVLNLEFPVDWGAHKISDHAIKILKSRRYEAIAAVEAGPHSERVASFRQCLKALNDLDQLFIAV